MTDRDVPPALLDGHHVVRYAVVDRRVPPPPHFSVVAGGVPVDLDTVSRLVAAEDLVEGHVYLMHCNDDWATIAAEMFPDADAAQRSAEARYAGVKAPWRERPLSEAERQEVQTTRAFLREIAAEFPNE
jgi:hypothetical protein